MQSHHYQLADPDLKRISSQNRIEKVITTLATFHALCTAFELKNESNLDAIFPFLNASNIWFHADMQVSYLKYARIFTQFTWIFNDLLNRFMSKKCTTLVCNFSSLSRDRKRRPNGLNSEWRLCKPAINIWRLWSTETCGTITSTLKKMSYLAAGKCAITARQPQICAFFFAPAPLRLFGKSQPISQL